MAVKKHILSIEEGTTVNAWPFDGTVTFTLPSAIVAKAGSIVRYVRSV